MSVLVVNFFSNSEVILDFVLKPLEHIRGNWDVIWDFDNDKYQEEENSFGSELNSMINEISKVKAPSNYHEHEDKVAFFQSKSWVFIRVRDLWWPNNDQFNHT